MLLYRVQVTPGPAKVPGEQHVNGVFTMSVDLPRHFKGTLMSRVIEVLNEDHVEVALRTPRRAFDPCASVSKPRLPILRSPSRASLSKHAPVRSEAPRP